LGVFDVASLLVDRRARRAKTDRLDAAGLLRTLTALSGSANFGKIVQSSPWSRSAGLRPEWGDVLRDLDRLQEIEINKDGRQMTR
jgi:hypothetical protein